MPLPKYYHDATAKTVATYLLLSILLVKTIKRAFMRFTSFFFFFTLAEVDLAVDTTEKNLTMVALLAILAWFRLGKQLNALFDASTRNTNQMKWNKTIDKYFKETH